MARAGCRGVKATNRRPSAGSDLKVGGDLFAGRARSHKRGALWSGWTAVRPSRAEPAPTRGFAAADRSYGGQERLRSTGFNSSADGISKLILRPSSASMEGSW